ncbi:hypothetical protein ACFJGW_00780 [Burkholderiaceae bacterium UC74_6]
MDSSSDLASGNSAGALPPANLIEMMNEAARVLKELNGLRDAARQELDLIRSTQGEAAAQLIKMTGEMTEATAHALAVKTRISDEQTVIAQKSQHIEDARLHADGVRSDLDRLVIAVNKQVAEVESARDSAASAAQTADTELGEIRDRKATAVTEAEATAESSAAAKNASEVTAGLARKAKSLETRIGEFEETLVDLHRQSATQLEEIVKLLPGATAAGLAHSFNERRKTFTQPSLGWQRVFVGSVVSLAVLALWGLLQAVFSHDALTYDGLIRLWLMRLPIAGALIWLAMHASRESALAKRLEEDYGYKAAVAASFQGFQQQMAELGEKAAVGSPLMKLCEDTLAAIGSPPGRIYDKHELAVNPSEEVLSLLKSIKDSVKPGT